MTEHPTKRYIRRRRGPLRGPAPERTSKEKVRILEETYLPGMSVLLVVRRCGIGASQFFTGRRLMERLDFDLLFRWFVGLR